MSEPTNSMAQGIQILTLTGLEFDANLGILERNTNRLATVRPKKIQSAKTT